MADDVSLAAPLAPVVPKRFTWEEVVAMADAGLFGEADRVELIGGEIFVMPPEGPRHVDGVHAVEDWLRSVLPPALKVFVRAPVRLPDGVVIPDVSVFPAGAKSRDMTASAALLIVEVSDSTLSHDLARKEPRYREAGAAEVWIADPAARRIWVKRGPAPEGWRLQKAHEAGDPAAPACAPGAGFDPAALAAGD